MNGYKTEDIYSVDADTGPAGIGGGLCRSAKPEK
jgi:hypothetical protein